MCMGVYASVYVHGGQKRGQVSFSVTLSAVSLEAQSP